MNGGSTPPLALFRNWADGIRTHDNPYQKRVPYHLATAQVISIYQNQGYVAQLAEQWTFNPTVLGSNPSIPITCMQEKTEKVNLVEEGFEPPANGL